MGVPAATVIAALLAVLALIGLAAHALKSLRPRLGVPVSGALAIQGVLALDARRRIYLISCADRRVVLMTGGGNDVVLGWLPPEAGA